MSHSYGILTLPRSTKDIECLLGRKCLFGGVIPSGTVYFCLSLRRKVEVTIDHRSDAGADLAPDEIRRGYNTAKKYRRLHLDCVPVWSRLATGDRLARLIEQGREHGGRPEGTGPIQALSQEDRAYRNSLLRRRNYWLEKFLKLDDKKGCLILLRGAIWIRMELEAMGAPTLKSMVRRGKDRDMQVGVKAKEYQCKANPGEPMHFPDGEGCRFCSWRYSE